MVVPPISMVWIDTSPRAAARANQARKTIRGSGSGCGRGGRFRCSSGCVAGGVGRAARSRRRPRPACGRCRGSRRPARGSGGAGSRRCCPASTWTVRPHTPPSCAGARQPSAPRGCGSPRRGRDDRTRRTSGAPPRRGEAHPEDWRCPSCPHRRGRRRAPSAGALQLAPAHAGAAPSAHRSSIRASDCARTAGATTRSQQRQAPVPRTSALHQ